MANNDFLFLIVAYGQSQCCCVQPSTRQNCDDDELIQNLKHLGVQHFPIKAHSFPPKCSPLHPSTFHIGKMCVHECKLQKMFDIPKRPCLDEWNITYDFSVCKYQTKCLLLAFTLFLGFIWRWIFKLDVFIWELKSWKRQFIYTYSVPKT